MKTLANKCRPKTLSEVIGQDAVKKAIYGKLADDNIPKASLFYGIKGTGKTSMARILAKALNCENPTENGPCCQCDSCKAIDADQSTDVIELDAASHNGVADVTAIIEKAQFLPYGKKKVIILDEVHMLSIAAFNKLLKIVEEPPKHVHFIFCTTEKNKVPATILSRCNQFEFKKISDTEILDNLKSVCGKEGFEYDEDALKMITKSADGSVRDSLSILEQLAYGKKLTKELVADTLGYAPEEVTFGLLQSINDRNLKAAVSYLQTAVNGGTSMISFIRDIVNALMDVVNVTNGLDIHSVAVTTDYAEYLKRICTQMDAETALFYIRKITEALGDSKSCGLEMAVQLAVLQLITQERKQDSLTMRIAELENKLHLLENSQIEKIQPAEKSATDDMPDNVIPIHKDSLGGFTDIGNTTDIPFDVDIDMVPGTNEPIREKPSVQATETVPKLVIPGGEIIGSEKGINQPSTADAIDSVAPETEQKTASAEKPVADTAKEGTLPQGEKSDIFSAGFGSFGCFFSPSARQS